MMGEYELPAVETGQRMTNRAAPSTECRTCGGDRFVVVSLRKPLQTAWMKERGIEPREEMIEEMAPCPDCNPIEVEFRRNDGVPFRSLDPSLTRQRMKP